MINDGMGEFVGQHAFIEILQVQIDRIVFVAVPGSDAAFLSVYVVKGPMQLILVLMEADVDLVDFFPHAQNRLYPFKKQIHLFGDGLLHILGGRRGKEPFDPPVPRAVIDAGVKLFQITFLLVMNGRKPGIQSGPFGFIGTNPVARCRKKNGEKNDGDYVRWRR